MRTQNRAIRRTNHAFDYAPASRRPHACRCSPQIACRLPPPRQLRAHASSSCSHEIPAVPESIQPARSHIPFLPRCITPSSAPLNPLPCNRRRAASLQLSSHSFCRLRACLALASLQPVRPSTCSCSVASSTVLRRSASKPLTFRPRLSFIAPDFARRHAIATALHNARQRATQLTSMQFPPRCIVPTVAPLISSPPRWPRAGILPSSAHLNLLVFFCPRDDLSPTRLQAAYMKAPLRLNRASRGALT